MNEKESKNLFKRVLKELGVYGLYKYTYEKMHYKYETIFTKYDSKEFYTQVFDKYVSYNLSMCKYLDFAFNWNGTEQGPYFWNSIYGILLEIEKNSIKIDSEEFNILKTDFLKKNYGKESI
jgi:hypothetical protein